MKVKTTAAVARSQKAVILTQPGVSKLRTDDLIGSREPSDPTTQTRNDVQLDYLRYLDGEEASS